MSKAKKPPAPAPSMYEDEDTDWDPKAAEASGKLPPPAQPEKGSVEKFFRLVRKGADVYIVTLLVQNGVILERRQSEEDVLDIQSDKITRTILNEMLTE